MFDRNCVEAVINIFLFVSILTSCKILLPRFHRNAITKDKKLDKLIILLCLNIKMNIGLAQHKRAVTDGFEKRMIEN